MPSGTRPETQAVRQGPLINVASRLRGTQPRRWMLIDRRDGHGHPVLAVSSAYVERKISPVRQRKLEVGKSGTLGRPLAHLDGGR